MYICILFHWISPVGIESYPPNLELILSHQEKLFLSLPFFICILSSNNNNNLPFPLLVCLTPTPFPFIQLRFFSMVSLILFSSNKLPNCYSPLYLHFCLHFPYLHPLWLFRCSILLPFHRGTNLIHSDFVVFSRIMFPPSRANFLFKSPCFLLPIQNNVKIHRSANVVTFFI